MLEQELPIGVASDFVTKLRRGAQCRLLETFHKARSIEPAIRFYACYAAGTAIATPDGERAVETLVAGDLVLTTSATARPVKWVLHNWINIWHWRPSNGCWRGDLGAEQRRHAVYDSFMPPAHLPDRSFTADDPIKHLP
jgi:hypothetical protein